VSSSAGPGAAPDGPRRPDRAAHGPSWPGLQASALRGRDVVILSLASAGPTQSIAVTLAALLAAVGYASFLPLLICFIPMLGIAVGYQRLNAWQPSAGATYSWVGRALNPHAGFSSGWIMLMYYTIGTTSLTIPLGTYMLSFFSNAAANNKYDVALVGTAFDLIVLVVAALGIKLSARFQWGWAIFEYGLLVGFTIAAIARDLRRAPDSRRAPDQFVVHAERRRRVQGADLRGAAGDLPVLRLGHRRLRGRGSEG
jgi:amino acid permease